MSKPNTMPPAHEDIATLAYALWLRDGCPEGAHEEHWRRAEEQLIKTPRKAKPLQKKGKATKKQSTKKPGTKKKATKKVPSRSARKSLVSIFV